MSVSERYLLDTCAIIDFFSDYFPGNVSKLTPRIRHVIEEGLYTTSNIALFVSSMSFIEIYVKWATTQENRERLKYEVIDRVVNATNVGLVPVATTTLEELVTLHGLAAHDFHDKLILSTAIEFDCKLISSDAILTNYVFNTNCIRGVFY